MTDSIHHRRNYLIAQAIHLLVLILFVSESKGQVIIASGIINIFLYSWLFKSELPQSRKLLPSPLLIYVMAGIIIQGLAPIWAGAAMLGGHSQPFWHGRFNVASELLSGHIILGVGDWMLVGGYTLGAWLYPGKKDGDSVPIKDVRGTAIALICVGLFAGLLDRAGFSLGDYVSGLKMFDQFAVPAGMLMLLFAGNFASATDRRANLWLALLVLAVQLPISLTSNMKQQTMVAIYPFVIYILAQIKWNFSVGRPPWLLLFAGLGVVWAVSFVLFPFSQLRRDDLWVGRQRLEKVPDALPYLAEALQASIPMSKSFNKLHEFPESGFWKFFKRHSYSKGAAWSYCYATYNGDQNNEFIKDGFIAVIPRLLWPDKPIISPGRKIAVLLGQAKNFEDATTATDSGAMAGALFLNGKWPCVILGMFVNGLLLQVIWQRVRLASLLNPFAVMCIMMIYVSTGRFFGSSTDGNVSFYVTIAVVYAPLIWLYGSAVPLKLREKSSRLLKGRRVAKAANRRRIEAYDNHI